MLTLYIKLIEYAYSSSDCIQIAIVSHMLSLMTFFTVVEAIYDLYRINMLIMT